MSGEEIKIVAVMDTTDVASGINRIAASTQNIQQTLQEQFNGAADGADEAGQNVGESFLNGMLKRMLIRDAIMTILRSIGDVFVQAGKTYGDLMGENIDLSLKGWMDKIGTTIGYLVVGSSVSNANQSVAHEAKEIEQIRSDEAERIKIDEYKKGNPLLFPKTSSQIEDEIEAVHKSQYQSEEKVHAAKIQGVQFTEKYGAPGAALAASHTLSAENDLKNATVANRSKLRFLEEELQLAHKKEELLKEIQKRWDEQTKKEEREADNADKAKWERILHTTFAQREIDKKEKEHANSETISADEKQKHLADVDLSFTRNQLDHQKATSAVQINGGLFGRNDSAQALVQHAAQQVDLLRSIDRQIKNLKQQNYELTLQ